MGTVRYGRVALPTATQTGCHRPHDDISCARRLLVQADNENDDIATVSTFNHLKGLEFCGYFRFPPCLSVLLDLLGRNFNAHAHALLHAYGMYQPVILFWIGFEKIYPIQNM